MKRAVLAACIALLAGCVDDEPVSTGETTESLWGCGLGDKYCGGCAVGSCAAQPAYYVCPTTGAWVFGSQCAPDPSDGVCKWQAPSCPLGSGGPPGDPGDPGGGGPGDECPPPPAHCQ
jgi:hypothetical protein